MNRRASPRIALASRVGSWVELLWNDKKRLCLEDRGFVARDRVALECESVGCGENGEREIFYLHLELSPTVAASS